jgi:hypothetical protein
MQIVLNGRSFRVRSSLWTFLHIARQQSLTDTWLWIDAVCIDQSCIPERNHQVGFMDKIYKEAEGVIGWLGPAADRSDWVLGALQSATRGKVNGTGRSNVLSKVFLEQNSITALIFRPYWRQIWIVQELMLNLRVLFFCGKRQVSWREMDHLVREVMFHIEGEKNKRMKGRQDETTEPWPTFDFAFVIFNIKPLFRTARD